MDVLFIQRRIFEIRGQLVILDFHLAEIYELKMNSLKQAIQYNAERFPSDYMFQLTTEEYDFLRYSFSIFENGEKYGRKNLPFAFSEQGVAMMASVLRSSKAIHVNIDIIRTFVQIRQSIINKGKIFGN
ncbi:ORF6N domain-containing protein [Sunxiuqinia elliptica]